MNCVKFNMRVDRNALDNLLIQLPEELQNEVFRFAESLLQKSGNSSSKHETQAVRSFFGIWDSGDPRSGDNDRIDADVARA